MVRPLSIIFCLCFAMCSQSAMARMQGNVQLKTGQHGNFNLASDADQAVSESISSVSASLTWYRASSKQLVWLLNGYYNFSEYEKYTHLTGSSVALMGGMFYRINQTNSMTAKVGKRERKYDDDELRLYQADAYLASLQLSHRLSSSTLLNEKVQFEENQPNLGSNRYHSISGQLWFSWNVAHRTSLYMGYTRINRSYESGAEYLFEEPYVSLSYSLSKNMFTRLGYSKLRVQESTNGHSYNASAYIAIGFGF